MVTCELEVTILRSELSFIFLQTKGFLRLKYIPHLEIRLEISTSQFRVYYWWKTFKEGWLRIKIKPHARRPWTPNKITYVFVQIRNNFRIREIAEKMRSLLCGNCLKNFKRPLDRQYYCSIFWFVQKIVPYAGDIECFAIYCAIASTDVQPHCGNSPCQNFMKSTCWVKLNCFPW